MTVEENIQEIIRNRREEDRMDLERFVRETTTVALNILEGNLPYTEFHNGDLIYEPTIRPLYESRVQEYTSQVQSMNAINNLNNIINSIEPIYSQTGLTRQINDFIRYVNNNIINTSDGERYLRINSISERYINTLMRTAYNIFSYNNYPYLTSRRRRHHLPETAREYHRREAERAFRQLLSEQFDENAMEERIARMNEIYELHIEEI
ncbi:MAG: hypothetical protein KatS3mg002_0171 [Candidatus Woesearchaeota archaeon]|nr:MAG: hypothetical protein KatS3mg002_0171 [Candidatus Woesearchaeota archaeon]